MLLLPDVEQRKDSCSRKELKEGRTFYWVPPERLYK